MYSNQSKVARKEKIQKTNKKKLKAEVLEEMIAKQVAVRHLKMEVESSLEAEIYIREPRK